MLKIEKVAFIFPFIMSCYFFNFGSITKVLFPFATLLLKRMNAHSLYYYYFGKSIKKKKKRKQ